MSSLLAELAGDDDEDAIDLRALRRVGLPTAVVVAPAPPPQDRPATKPPATAGHGTLGSIQQSALSSALAVVQTASSTLTTKSFSADQLAKPSAEAQQLIAERTRQALQVAVEKKEPPPAIRPKGEVKVLEVGGDFGVARTVAVVDAQRDPLDPRSVKIVKLKQQATVDAAPVIRSPTKRSEAAQSASGGSLSSVTRVPSVVKAWSNPKGFVVPLAQREEADGRNHMAVQMHNDHSELATALREAEKEQQLESQKRRIEEAQRLEAEQLAREKELEEKAKAALEEKRAARRGETAEERNLRRQREVDDRDREKEELRKMRRTENAAKRLGITAEELSTDVTLQRQLEEQVLDLDDARLQGRPARSTNDEGLYDEALFGKGRTVAAAPAAAVSSAFDISDLLH